MEFRRKRRVIPNFYIGVAILQELHRLNPSLGNILLYIILLHRPMHRIIQEIFLLYLLLHCLRLLILNFVCFDLGLIFPQKTARHPPVIPPFHPDIGDVVFVGGGAVGVAMVSFRLFALGFFFRRSFLLLLWIFFI